jgi:hypothetical protein
MLRVTTELGVEAQAMARVTELGHVGIYVRDLERMVLPRRRGDAGHQAELAPRHRLPQRGPARLSPTEELIRDRRP